MRKNYTEIEGWCADEITSIYDEAISRAKGGEIFVELGCYKGRSTCYMIDSIIKSGKNIKFYVVDNFSTLGDVKAQFFENLGEERIKKIIFLEQDSYLSASNFLNESVDYLFIDTDHKFEVLDKELSAWIPKVKIGGIISGHDFNNGGVKQAVEKNHTKNIFVNISTLQKDNNINWRYYSWWFEK